MVIGILMETGPLSSEHWIGVTGFVVLNRDPPEGHHVGSRQTDQETGHHKPCTHLDRKEWSRMSKKLSAQSHKWAEENPNRTQ